jgi:electron transfer flavoprotein beta subunit
VRIAVCIKQVPDTSVRLEVDETGLRPRGSGYLPVLNPYDEFALEEALRLRDAAGGREVVVLTLTHEPCDETIFHALAMGADRALILESPANAGTTPRFASLLLAAALEDMRPDLVFCGNQAVDDDAASVGPAIAGLLGWPQVCGVETVGLQDGGRTINAVCRRGGSRHTFMAPVPCLLTFLRGPVLPRYPSMDGIFSARSKPIERRRAELGRSGGAIERARLYAPPDARAREMISGNPLEAAEALLDRVCARVDVL